ncbi:MAG: hydrolase [Planctomycetales bacterium]|nr:hydrolase [Planctomycetales bacterium]
MVDVQDRLLSVIPDRERLMWTLQRLAAGAQILGVPCLATEQYPEKLGPTSPRLQPYLSHGTGPGESIPGKLTFSCVGCESLVRQVERLGRRQVLVTGLETHVCVLQTALDLVTAGYDVYLAVDAVATRNQLDHEIALRRMELAGVTLMTIESALFEWCERAGTQQFKEISQIVRQTFASDQ